jgi:prephenate dehydrogenase
MRIAILGGGRMGRWFARFFAEEGFSVMVSDKKEATLSRVGQDLEVETSTSNREAVQRAEWILICVPLKDFEDVVQEIGSQVQPNQVVMDIGSVKEQPVKVMHKYVRVGITLGTHPMFGPTATSIQNQNFVVTPTDAKEREFARTFTHWLEARQGRVSVLSPRRHDELMSLVLGLSHFVGMVVGDTLVDQEEFAETLKVTGPSYRQLLALAKNTLSQDPDFYATLQMTLPGLERIEESLCQKSLELLDTVRRKDAKGFARKMSAVQESMKRFKQGTALID